MNVFMLDEDMWESSMMMDDAHLRAQINEGVQILMTIFNMRLNCTNSNVKIGYANHPVVKMYDAYNRIVELASYLEILMIEYRVRFSKYHTYWFWIKWWLILIISGAFQDIWLFK